MYGRRDAAFEIKPLCSLRETGKLLINYSGFVWCRQSASEPTAGTYNVGLFGFSSEVPAKRVVKIGFANLGISGCASLCLGLLGERSNNFIR